MIRPPPRSTRTDTLFPYTTLFRSIFLTFDGTAVAGEKAFLLHRAAQRRFIFGERLADAMLDGARLTRKTAALHGADHVILARSEEHTSELQSLMRISYAVFCLKNKTNTSRHLRHILTFKMRI